MSVIKIKCNKFYCSETHSDNEILFCIKLALFCKKKLQSYKKLLKKQHNIWHLVFLVSVKSVYLMRILQANTMIMIKIYIFVTFCIQQLTHLNDLKIHVCNSLRSIISSLFVSIFTNKIFNLRFDSSGLR